MRAIECRFCGCLVEEGSFHNCSPIVSALTHTHEAAMKEFDKTETLLAERGKTHGDFRDHAAVTQNLKTTFYNTADKKLLRATQREAVDMILHKLGRIAAGDPNFKDHWDDIAGYARLVSQDLERG